MRSLVRKAPGGRASRGWIAAAACALVAASAIAAACAAAPKSDEAGKAERLPAEFFGVNMGPVPTARDAGLMARDGVRTGRLFIYWPSVQPGRHASFYWGVADTIVRRLAKQGIRSLPVLLGTPRWVSHDPRVSPVTNPQGRRGWKRFVRSAVRRYGPGGSFWQGHPGLPYRPIRAWQIGNEPNFPAHWDPHPSPRGYKQLLRISANVIRDVNPDLQVVLSGLGPGLARPSQIPSWRFLRRLYQVGAKPYFDVAADHPYAADTSGVAVQLRNVAKVMRKAGDRKTPLWITELGWASSRIPHSHLAVGRRRQAQLLQSTFRYIVRHAHELRIRRLLWFNWRDPSASYDRCKDCVAMGLRHFDERPKPVLQGYERFATR